MKPQSVLAKRVRVVVGLAALGGLLAASPARTALGADEIDPEVKKLIAKLSDPSPPTRIAAAKKLGEVGQEKSTAAVARALCNASQATGPMRTAAFDSLQKVHPKLYPDAVTLISDNNPKNHYIAQGGIAKLGVDGNAATPVLLTHLKHHASSGASATSINEEYLKTDSNEFVAIPTLRRLTQLKGDALDRELLRIGWLGLAYVSAGLASSDMLVLSVVAPEEPTVVQTVAQLTDHKSNMVRFSALVALDHCDIAVVSNHHKYVKKHKLDDTKPIRELAVDLDKKIETHVAEKKKDKKP